MKEVEEKPFESQLACQAFQAGCRLFIVIITNNSKLDFGSKLKPNFLVSCMLPKLQWMKVKKYNKRYKNLKQMKQNSSNYEQLVRINRQLHKQLKDAHSLIASLRSQNIQLKQRLAFHQNSNENQNEQSTVHHLGHGTDDEIFTESSNEDSQQQQKQYHNLNQQAEETPVKRIQSQSQNREQLMEIPVLTPLSVGKTEPRAVLPPKVIFNYQTQNTHVPKVLLRQPKKQSNKQIPENTQEIHEVKWGNFSVQHSAIKSEEPILQRNNSSIFQRVRNSNKIYDYFFVTGYSFKENSRMIQYCYPTQSQQFSAILSLIYTQNSLRLFQNSSSGKSPRSTTNLKIGKLNVKDSFVMILYKQKNFQRQYLFACQAEDILEGPDRNLYIFNRLFCFITSNSFFSAFMKISEQFINKINSTKQDFKISSPIHQKNAKQQLRNLLQEHLKILWEKNVKQNQYVNFSLGNQINMFIDVPSSSQSYRTLLQYRPWGILFTPIYFPTQSQPLLPLSPQSSHSTQPLMSPQKQKQLFGYLLIYLLTETKILLYSMTKSKVSQAILHVLQMIKPLEYVNPIIMATIRDQHQEYFNAPMSIVLGLWGQLKPKRKQKIQIFMNKKPTSSLTYIIEQNKNLANQLDGVIFNLDNGYTCGMGLTAQKNKLANQINYVIQNGCKSTKQKYKLIQSLICNGSGVGNGRSFQNMQMKELSNKLIKQISNTQLYSFYLQKSNDIMQF